MCLHSLASTCSFREGTERKGEERVLLSSKKLSKANVVRDEGGDDTEVASGLSEILLESELASGKNSKSSGKESEESNEGDALAESDDEEQECENKPGDEVDSEGALELRCICEGRNNTGAGNEDGGEGHPESTIGSEGSSTEHVSTGELPHASKELGSATTEDGHTDNDVRMGNTPGAYVVEGEDEGGGSEGEQPESCGVGDLGGRPGHTMGCVSLNVSFLEVRRHC